MMANVITGLRILVSAVLLFCPVFSPIFYVLYLIAGLSDMVDGVIARKTNSVSEFGSRLDGVADFVFVAVCLSPAYIHGNPDMFSGDICGCSGRTFHKDRKGD